MREPKNSGKVQAEKTLRERSQEKQQIGPIQWGMSVSNRASKSLIWLII
jgi:hypothetical protein